LPAIPLKITASKVLTGGSCTLKQTSVGITIAVAPESRQAIDTLIELKLDGLADALEVTVNWKNSQTCPDQWG
jgi:hypothetical protein